ncbi:polysaccharide deacetylase family protein [Streptomyces meridianus]|uniref:Polysaccharide deacetylase family protein n=1 Tax=Streptomyces meridianus TaxID=2938945 RepID=A0ABT0X5Q8_9ACTN|nr:polysaccharide deacetylase family protein [Streptomyces meridianus]MCM2577861.1 polysaccharide deacetylase family protein [Streptomyces meridianus]
MRTAAFLALASFLALGVNPTDSTEAGAAAEDYSASRCGNTSGRVLLTFDDWGYSDPYRATAVGEYLRSRGIRAAYFLVNEFAQEHDDIVRELRGQGHWVANHSYSHPHLTRLTDDGARQEIEGGIRSTLLRPPYGDYGPREETMAADLGMRICTWTLDTLDWEVTGDGYRSAESIRAIVRDAPASEKAGGVVLGHLEYHFPDAVGGIIDDLHAQGYLFCRNSGPVDESVPFPLDCGE